MPPARAAQLPLRATPQMSALLAFDRTAALLSFSRAAIELAVTPSAISHQIRNLEQYFGTQLFTRGGRTVALTPTGKAFADEVRAGLAQLDRASRDLLCRGRSNRDHLRVRVSTELSHLFMFDALSEFEKRHPQFRVSLDVARSGAAPASDDPLLIVQIGREGLTNMRLRPLIDIWTVPAASPDLAVRLDEPEDLLRQRLIHVRSHPTAWRDWLDRPDIDPTQGAAVWVDDIADGLLAAEAGLGVALAPWPLVTQRTERPLRLSFGARPDPSRRQTIYMASRPDQKDDRRVTAFGGWLQEKLQILGARSDSLLRE